MIQIERAKLEYLVEQAFLNGVSAGAISRMNTGSVTSANFKESTAFDELQEIIKKSENDTVEVNPIIEEIKKITTDALDRDLHRNQLTEEWYSIYKRALEEIIKITERE